MNSQIAVLDSQDRLILSQQALGLHAGSRIEVIIEQGKVPLRNLEPAAALTLEDSSPSSVTDEKMLQQRKHEAKSR